MRGKQLSVLAVVLAWNASALAADGPYSLSQCYDLALKRSDALAGQAEAITQTDERIWQARAAFLPTVSTNATVFQQEDPGSGLASTVFPSSQTTVKATASLNLFKGLRDLSLLRQRGAEKDAAGSALEQARVQLYLDTVQTYYNVLAYEHDLQHYRSEIAASEKRKSELRSLKSLARAREADIVSVESSVASVDAQMASTEGLLGQAREALAFLTGLPPDAALAEETPALPALEPAEAWLSKIEERPDVAQARSSLEAQDLAIGTLRSNHLPSADVSANYYFQRPGLQSNVTWDVSLGVTLPIFSGGLMQAQVREANSLRTGKEIALNQLRKQAERDVRAAHAIARANLDQIGRLERASRLAQTRYELLLKDNRQGLASNLDVLTALATAFQTKRSYDHARFTVQYDLQRLQALSKRISP